MAWLRRRASAGLRRRPRRPLGLAGHLSDLIAGAAPFFGLLFTAVVLGIVDEAVATARAQLAPRADSLRPYEQVEWSQAELDAWTMAQVFEGGLRAIESGRPAQAARCAPSWPLPSSPSRARPGSAG